MDASCKIQRSIHDVRLTYKYVSRILGTYHIREVVFLLWYFAVVKNSRYSTIGSKEKGE